MNDVKLAFDAFQFYLLLRYLMRSKVAARSKQNLQFLLHRSRFLQSTINKLRVSWMRCEVNTKRMQPEKRVMTNFRLKIAHEFQYFRLNSNWCLTKYCTVNHVQQNTGNFTYLNDISVSCWRQMAAAIAIVVIYNAPMHFRHRQTDRQMDTDIVA